MLAGRSALDPIPAFALGYDLCFMLADDSTRDQQKFAARYAQMTDGELLEIALQPWALSEIAWEALEDELDSRQLELPEPEPPPQVVSIEKRNLVLLRSFRDVPEALLAKGCLDSAGIECLLADDNMVRMDWFISNLLGGVKLLVDGEDFAQALRVLNDPIPPELELDAVGEYAQAQCPKCGSLETSFAELTTKISYPGARRGMPVPLKVDGWKCDSCGLVWPEAPS
jgi:hypothetical protein